MPEHSVLLDTFLKLTGPSCCICHIQCLIQDFQLGGAICPSHQFSISSLSLFPPPSPWHLFKLVPRNLWNWAFYVCYFPWILVLALLLIWNLNQNIVLGRFCTRRIYISLFFFFLNTIWSVPEWPRTGIWKGHICSNCGNPAMACSRSDTEHLIALSPLYTNNYY